MTRDEQIKRHNQNVKAAFQAAKHGEVINLTALMGGAEEISINDIEKKEDRKCYSDGWKVEKGGKK